MRLVLAICCFALLIAPTAWTTTKQQASSPKKTLTPEQQDFQRRWHDYMAKRPNLQATANQIFEAELGREKMGACPNAATTYDVNVCLGKEVDITEQNLKQYGAAIRELIASLPDDPAGLGSGPAGPVLTSAQSATEFDKVEQAWHQYRDVACKAARDLMGGGTAASSSEMQCDLTLDRSHMRELDSVYWLKLHK